MIDSNHTPDMPRRRFIGLGLAASMVRHSATAIAQPPPGQVPLTVDEEAELASIEVQARKAVIGSIRRNSGAHFLVVGDAADGFQKEVLDFCERLGKAFLAYFAEKGFVVVYPNRRMTVLVLKDRKSYGAWIGDAAEGAVGGHYDLDSNRLVVFDFRNEEKNLGDQAAKVNSFTLAHEANHLLGFNTGLLDRNSDIPTCVSEGLATYGELFQKTGRSAIGELNRPRISALVEATRRGDPWIDLETLVADDEVCTDPKTYQLAYAESWLLISMLLKKPDMRPKLRAYLEILKRHRKNVDRVAEFEQSIGPIDALNRELRSYARQVLRR